jgi:hypothetical protein
LPDLGVEKNVIITVPRIGFKISEEVIITSDNDYSSSFTLPTLAPEPPGSLLWQHRKVAILFIPLVIGLMLFSQFFTHKKQSSTAIFTQDKCTIYGAGALRAGKYSEIKSCSPRGSIVLRQRKFIFSTDN